MFGIDMQKVQDTIDRITADQAALRQGQLQILAKLDQIQASLDKLAVK